MRKSANKARAVVFGGSGFLGGHIADCLSRNGYSTTVADINPSRHLQPQQEFVKCDILDLEQVRNVVENADFVFHTAALADIEESAQNPVQTIRVNILGTTHVLEACRLCDVKRFLFASTVYVSS